MEKSNQNKLEIENNDNQLGNKNESENNSDNLSNLIDSNFHFIKSDSNQEEENKLKESNENSNNDNNMNQQEIINIVPSQDEQIINNEQKNEVE